MSILCGDTNQNRIGLVDRTVLGVPSIIGLVAIFVIAFGAQFYNFTKTVKIRTNDETGNLVWIETSVEDVIEVRSAGKEILSLNPRLYRVTVVATGEAGFVHLQDEFGTTYVMSTKHFGLEGLNNKIRVFKPDSTNYNKLLVAFEKSTKNH